MVMAHRRELVTGGDPDEVYPAPADGDYVDESGRRHAFLFAGDVEQIAFALIARHQVRFAHLAEARIIYRWKRKGGERAGKVTYGACVRLGGLAAHLADAEFLIWLAADHVREAQLTRWEVEALIFHELCHTAVDEKGRFVVVGHDAELFTAELEEYGLWRPSLERTARAVRQLELFGDDGF